MSDENATLKDTVVVEEPTPSAPVVDKPEEPAPIRVVDEPSPDAAEIGRIILQSGYTKEQLNDLLTAPQALNALRYAIQNNPSEFLKTLERTDPKTGEKFLETMADTYVQRFGDKGKPSGGKQEPSTDLMREVEALRAETKQIRTERETERANATLAATRQRYESRVDDLFNLKEIKELNLPKSVQKGMRARIDVELARDPSVVQRASNGNFVDVPKAFQGIIDEWVSDKKSAQEAEKTQRERAQKGAFPEFQNGPNFMNFEIPAGTADSWDSTEAGFAKALERTA